MCFYVIKLTHKNGRSVDKRTALVVVVVVVVVAAVVSSSSSSSSSGGGGGGGIYCFCFLLEMLLKHLTMKQLHFSLQTD
jgi:hypothetical protein